MGKKTEELSMCGMGEGEDLCERWIYGREK